MTSSSWAGGFVTWSERTGGNYYAERARIASRRGKSQTETDSAQTVGRNSSVRTAADSVAAATRGCENRLDVQ